MAKYKGQATKPDYFTDFRALRTLKEKQEAEKQGVDLEERELFTLSQMPGWGYLKTFIEDTQKELDEMIKTLMEQGASFEVIGQKTVTKELAKEILQKVINKVEYARETIESVGNSDEL
jgi:hypothetical protein